MSLFTGSGTALITPFDEKGIYWEAFAEQIEFQIKNGTKALIVCGTTGEPSTMTDEEKSEAIAFTVRQAAGRVPVIAGAGSNDTAHVVALCRQAEEIGADGLLIVTPYYNKTTQRGLIAHYTHIADSTKLPIIVYNVPSRTGLNMKPETLAALSRHPRIVAMKEASGDMVQVMEMARLCARRIDLYSGADEMTFAVMAAGGKGVISVVSNIVPAEMAALVESWLSGDIAASRAMQFRMNPLIDALFCETNPIPVKTAMNMLGMKAGLLRLPLVEMAPENITRLRKALEDFGLSA
ncbi:MAG: 4-hydroxy-tetrahydrodipicolinate synthase [Christensenellales bacterium]